MVGLPLAVREHRATFNHHLPYAHTLIDKGRPQNHLETKLDAPAGICNALMHIFQILLLLHPSIPLSASLTSIYWTVFTFICFQHVILFNINIKLYL